MTYRAAIRICLLLSILLPLSPAGADDGTGRQVLLQLPRTFLEEVIAASLPLELATDAVKLEGSVVIDEIENLQLASQQLSARLGLTGRQLQIITAIGNQQLRLQVGNLDLDLNITARLRFDPPSQTLFIIPQASPQPPPGEGGSGDLGQLLAGALSGREFPVAIEKLQPIITDLGSRQLLLDFQVGDITVNPDAVLFQLVPTVHSRPIDAAGKTAPKS